MMGSEDFSRVLEEVPGAYVFLGACVGDDPLSCAEQPLALARFAETVLPDAALLLASLAVRSGCVSPPLTRRLSWWTAPSSEKRCRLSPEPVERVSDPQGPRWPGR